MNHYPYILVVDIFLENELGEILMIHRDKNKAVLGGYYNGIGGKLEEFETPLESLHREVLEESGVKKMSAIQLKAVMTIQDKHGKWTGFIYTGKVKKSQVKNMIVPENEGVLEWVKKKDLGKKRLVPDLKLWYKKLFAPGLSYIKIDYDNSYRIKDIQIKSV